MIEGIDITTLITAVPVIGVLIAWLQSLRNQLSDTQERYDRLDAEFKQTLKERQQQIINERFLVGKLTGVEGGD
jgi:hypothetical protein